MKKLFFIFCLLAIVSLSLFASPGEFIDKLIASENSIADYSMQKIKNSYDDYIVQTTVNSASLSYSFGKIDVSPNTLLVITDNYDPSPNFFLVKGEILLKLNDSVKNKITVETPSAIYKAQKNTIFSVLSDEYNEFIINGGNNERKVWDSIYGTNSVVKPLSYSDLIKGHYNISIEDRTPITQKLGTIDINNDKLSYNASESKIIISLPSYVEKAQVLNFIDNILIDNKDLLKNITYKIEDNNLIFSYPELSTIHLSQAVSLLEENLSNYIKKIKIPDALTKIDSSSDFTRDITSYSGNIDFPMVNLSYKSFNENLIINYPSYVSSLFIDDFTISMAEKYPDNFKNVTYEIKDNSLSLKFANILDYDYIVENMNLFANELSKIIFTDIIAKEIEIVDVTTEEMDKSIKTLYKGSFICEGYKIEYIVKEDSISVDYPSFVPKQFIITLANLIIENFDEDLSYCEYLVSNDSLTMNFDTKITKDIFTLEILPILIRELSLSLSRPFSPKELDTIDSASRITKDNPILITSYQFKDYVMDVSVYDSEIHLTYPSFVPSLFISDFLTSYLEGISGVNFIVYDDLVVFSFDFDLSVDLIKPYLYDFGTALSYLLKNPITPRTIKDINSNINITTYDPILTTSFNYKNTLIDISAYDYDIYINYPNNTPKYFMDKLLSKLIIDNKLNNLSYLISSDQIKISSDDKLTIEEIQYYLNIIAKELKEALKTPIIPGSETLLVSNIVTKPYQNELIGSYIYKHDTFNFYLQDDNSISITYPTTLSQEFMTDFFSSMKPLLDLREFKVNENTVLLYFQFEIDKENVKNYLYFFKDALHKAIKIQDSTLVVNNKYTVTKQTLLTTSIVYQNYLIDLVATNRDISLKCNFDERLLLNIFDIIAEYNLPILQGASYKLSDESVTISFDEDLSIKDVKELTNLLVSEFEKYIFSDSVLLTGLINYDNIQISYAATTNKIIYDFNSELESAIVKTFLDNLSLDYDFTYLISSTCVIINFDSSLDKEDMQGILSYISTELSSYIKQIETTLDTTSIIDFAGSIVYDDEIISFKASDSDLLFVFPKSYASSEILSIFSAIIDNNLDDFNGVTYSINKNLCKVSFFTEIAVSEMEVIMKNLITSLQTDNEKPIVYEKTEEVIVFDGNSYIYTDDENLISLSADEDLTDFFH